MKQWLWVQSMQNNSNISISVILPVYNGLPFLKASVESVLQQTHPDFQFFIVDDRSDDGSADYLRTLNDPRVQLFFNENNKGLFYNLNLLIKKSDTSLIKLWSQDDIMYPGCIEQIVWFIANTRRRDLVIPGETSLMTGE